MNGTLLSDPSLLQQAWTQHFQSLAKSQEETNSALKESIEPSKTLLSTTFQEEVFLDVAFATEEVEATVNKMKVNKSAGPDSLMAEHVKYGGKLIITWLTEILNAIVDAEQIPSCLKQGNTVPVYKGGGKDPLNVNSYRSITINSVISKVLETLILNRLEPLFMDAGVPHPNQSAYRKSVSCADAIFATQEVLNRYLLEGGKVYMCLYDLEKAFDSVEFPVLLRRLFNVQNMAYPTKLVHRWPKLGSPRATSFHALFTGAWGATGVHLISSTIPTCHGPSVATATVSLYGCFSQQHVRWRLSTRG